MTPNAFRDPILQALRTLSNSVPGVAVRSRDATDLVFQRLGITDPDPKIRNNANFCATQVLKGQGLVDTPSRGVWTLTPQGASFVPGAAPLTLATLVDQQAPEPVPVSPWADDTVGVALYLLPVKDTYSEDSYIRSLAISQATCFGNHDESIPVCLSCPIAASCRSKQVLRLSAVATALRKRDEEAAKVTKLPAATTPSAPADENIEDVLADLEKSHARPSTPEGVDMECSVESVCYVCKKTMPEKTRGVYVTTIGFRHTTCP